jgi:hypothetical protein
VRPNRGTHDREIAGWPPLSSGDATDSFHVPTVTPLSLGLVGNHPHQTRRAYFGRTAPIVVAEIASVALVAASTTPVIDSVNPCTAVVAASPTAPARSP